MNLKVKNLPRVNPDGSPIPCDFPECGAPRRAQGLCNAHYQSLRTARRGIKALIPRVDADGTPLPCTEEGCSSDRVASGLCGTHHEKRSFSQAVLEVCPVEDCGRMKRVSGVLCKKCNQFRWRFSLTPEQVFLFWRRENRVCSNAACGSSENLHMDHDHACCPPGKVFEVKSRKSCGDCVRGWLCRNCNVALGLLHGSPSRIRGLADYVS